MASEGSGGRLIRNTVVNGIGTFGGVAVHLVLTPFIVVGLGKEAFGVWALALSITVVGGYASLTDLGVEQASARYIAEARADGDAARVNRLASNSQAIFIFVALALTPPLVLMAGSLVDLFDISPELRDGARLCFALTAGQLALELPARTYFAVLEGIQRFELFQALELIRTVTMVVVIVLALSFDWGIAGLGASLPASSGAVLVAGWATAHRTLPDLKLSPRDLHRPTLRSLVGLGAGLFVIRALSTVYRQMDRFIIGAALGARSVAVYEIANRIQAGAWIAQNVTASALVPATAFVRRDREVLRTLYLKGTMFAVAASLPVALAAIAFAEPLVLGWVGERLREAVGPTRLFLVYLLLAVAHAVGITMVIALGRLAPFIRILAMNLAVNLGVSLSLVDRLGIQGVIIGTLVGQAVTWVPMQRLMLQVFGVSGREWLRKVVLPNVPGVVAQVVACGLLSLVAGNTKSLPVAFVLVLVSMAASWAAFFAVGVPRPELERLKAMAREAVGR